MTTLEILRATRKRLSDPANWCGTGPAKGHNAVCVALAISHVQEGEFRSWGDAHRAVARLVPDATGNVARNVHVWNDASSTTHADVMAVLDCAIANEVAKTQEFTVSPLPEPIAV